MSNTQNIIDELALRVSDTPYDYTLSRALQRLVTLNSENTQLKAKIADGIRVYAEKVSEGSNGIWSGYEAHTMFPVEQSNAILLLDKE